MKKLILTSAVLFVIIFYACKKDSTPPKSTVDILRSHHWTEASAIYDPPYDVFDNGTLVADLLAQFPECMRDNLYIFDSGYIEFLDLEWVGSFKNSALAMINDFGNLRERSWKNKKFRHDLDLALIKHYRLKKHENLGKTIVKLSILRSVISLSGAFENYEHLKQEDSIQVKRRTETEKDILEIFNKD